MAHMENKSPLMRTPNSPLPSHQSPPPQSHLLAVSGKAPTWFVISLFCLAIYLIFIAWAQITFGSYPDALRYLAGDRLQVRPSALMFGLRRAGETLETTVSVRNHGSKPVRLMGALSDCSCMAYRGLPAILPPGQSLSLPIQVRFANKPGEWDQILTYLTDDARQPNLRVRLRGRIVAPTN